jgi:hypothetical protein
MEENPEDTIVDFQELRGHGGPSLDILDQGEANPEFLSGSSAEEQSSPEENSQIWYIFSLYFRH